jgi:hypothetical protein
MSRDTIVIRFRQPEAIDDPLTEVAREGAGRNPASASASVASSPQSDGAHNLPAIGDARLRPSHRGPAKHAPDTAGSFLGAGLSDVGDGGEDCRAKIVGN